MFCDTWSASFKHTSKCVVSIVASASCIHRCHSLFPCLAWTCPFRQVMSYPCSLSIALAAISVRKTCSSTPFCIDHLHTCSRAWLCFVREVSFVPLPVFGEQKGTCLVVFALLNKSKDAFSSLTLVVCEIWQPHFHPSSFRLFSVHQMLRR